MSILIKNVLFNDRTIDIYIEGKEIKQIGEGLSFPADKILDGSRKAVIPGFVNAHTHAAMTLFRGFGDDMPLMPWLEQKIWPNEAKMTREDVYWGAKLACLEMIKSGTTTFFDMYQRPRVTADVTEEMGLRGIIAGVCFDGFDKEEAEKCKRHNERLIQDLKWAHRFAMEHQIPIHLHLAETEGEVKDSLDRFGLTPVRYLYKLGVLSPRLIIAHGIYIDDDELRMLADHEVKVVHNPASNMKLASGIHFKFKEMRQLGITVGLGTDGCSSSNNLDMIEAMKLASLLGKAWRKDPEALTANEMLQAATAEGAAMFGLKAGQIKEGDLADLCLIDLNTPAFTPNFNFVSNLVYAANGSCVDTVICDGKILMENKKVPGEDEIMEKATEIAYNLMKR